MNKPLKIIVTLFILMGAFGLIAFALTNNKKKNEEATKIVSEVNASVAVRIDTVKQQVPNVDFVANGNFAPAQELSFSSEKAGRVVKVYADEGTYVRRGETLATIRVEQLSVDVQNANASYQNALTDKQRYENAFKTGGVTQQQVDQADLALTNAKTQLQHSKINLSDASIRATINGVVNKRYIEPGSVLAPGTPLFDLINVSTLKLKVTVNENQITNLKLGDIIHVKATVYPEADFTGRVTFIASKADATLNFPVEVEIANNNKLKAGMYGTAIFKTPEEAPINVVLRTAFVGSVNSKQVFVVDKNNTARSRTATAGRIIGDDVEVLDGLQAGDVVITSGQINLSDGSKITVIK